MLKLLSQILFFYIFTFKVLASPNFLNMPILDYINEDKWVIIEDRNYIPYLNFSKVEYNNLNNIEPDFSIYLDSSEQEYREHYYFLNYENNFIGETIFTYFTEEQLYSKKNKSMENLIKRFPQIPNNFKRAVRPHKK